MYKIKFFLSLLFVIYSSSSEGLTVKSASPQLEVALSKLYKLPNFKNFLFEIESAGPLSIEWVPLYSENFDAFWNSANRTIRINSLKNSQLETLVCSILFELHNAKSDTTFKNLYLKAQRGEISIETYVEKVEQMEHQNALNCSIFLENGIALGLLSKKAAWPILREFNDHYTLQQIHGHSDWIAKNYSQIAPFPQKNQPYKGTLPNLSSKGKESLLHYFKIKNKMESNNGNFNTEGLIALQKEYEKALKDQNREDLYLLSLVFKKEAVYQALLRSLA